MNWKAHIELLLATGWTVAEIAVEVGVTGNAIREISSGRTKSPRGDAALKLAALAPRAVQAGEGTDPDAERIVPLEEA